MTPHDLVEEIGIRLNISLKLDDAGLSRIMVDSYLPVDFEFDETGNRLLVYAVIGMLPVRGDGLERFFEELLTANLFGSAIGHCSPAVDGERNELILWFELDESIHLDTAMSMLENLIAQTEEWRKQLSAVGTRADAPPPADLPSMGGMDTFLRA